MRALLAGALLSSALGALGGCQDDASAIGRIDDAGVGVDGGRGRDAGASGDAAISSPPPLPGTLIARLPADLVAVTGGGAEILYRQSGELHRVSSDGTGAVPLGYRPEYGYGPSPNLWLFSELDADKSVGVLAGYAPLGPPLVTVLDRRVATDSFAVDAEGEVVVVATDVATVGDAASSTRTASLARFDVTGHKRVLREGVPLGKWDARTRQHTCSPKVELMSRTRALAVVCTTPGSSRRALVAIDLVTRTATTVASDVVSFLAASDDRSFALFANRQLAFFGVSPRGDRVVPLAEPRRVNSIAFLDGRRLAYTSVGEDLLTAAWPTLVPTQLLPAGAVSIEAVSDDGGLVMFRQVRAQTGLRDLFMVRTATGAAASSVTLSAEPSAYPGDDAFSADGAWVHWFARANANFIGDVTIAPTGGGGGPRVVASGAWLVNNMADPDRLAILGNARFAGDGRKLLADLTLAWRDGREANRVLVEGIDTDTYEVFPGGDRVVFRISEGANPGLWVRDLE